ncbi:MAG: sulfatase [Rhodopirellula sp.]|nr:sulfatase [Rhodopirellula sp.]
MNRFVLMLAVVVSLFVQLGVAFAESQAATKRPNILFAIADDWSFGHAGAYGCGWVQTPNFDRVAKEGILFTRAYTPNAKCAPSRAIILTGRYSWQLEEAGNHMAIFPPKFGSFMERLEADGYFTGYTGKGWAPGIANDVNGKPRRITGKVYQGKTAKPPATGISRNDYAANFADFLKSGNADKPWAFWLGTTEPHRGYEYGSGVRLGKKLGDIERIPGYWPDNETIRNDMLDYAVEVEHFDNHLGKALALLEAAGQLDNTLIVATSDHGMPFPRAKGQAYDHSNHIPLAIRWANGITGSSRVVHDFVDFADLAPTFLEAGGVSNAGPIMLPISGRSLMPIFKSDPAGQVEGHRDHVLVGKERHDIGRPNNWGYPIRGIVKGDMLYLHNFETERWPAGDPITGYLNCDGSPTKSVVLEMRRNGSNKDFWDLCFGKRPADELYDLSSDPDCVTNLATQPAHAQVMAALKLQLFRELKAQGDPRMSGHGSVFDSYPYSGASTDNFYQRFTSGEKVKAGWVNPSDFEKEPLE